MIQSPAQGAWVRGHAVEQLQQSASMIALPQRRPYTMYTRWWQTLALDYLPAITEKDTQRASSRKKHGFAASRSKIYWR